MTSGLCEHLHALAPVLCRVWELHSGALLTEAVSWTQVLVFTDLLVYP